MKKVIILILSMLLLASAVPAQAQYDENTASEMTALRKKLGQMKREMDLLMRDIMATPPVIGEPAPAAFGSDVYVDVFQNDRSVIVKADLPGMDKDKIDITLERDKFLKISGSREVVKSEKSPNVIKQERFSGKFSKVIELPCEVMPTGINATYKEGVLEITIPKKAAAPKEEAVKISIK